MDWSQTSIDSLLATVAGLKYQLDEEIKSRSWFITTASTAQVMGTNESNDEFWKNLIKNMGEGYSHIADAPFDPSLN